MMKFICHSSVIETRAKDHVRSQVLREKCEKAFRRETIRCISGHIILVNLILMCIQRLITTSHASHVNLNFSLEPNPQNSRSKTSTFYIKEHKSNNKSPKWAAATNRTSENFSNFLDGNNIHKTDK